MGIALQGVPQGSFALRVHQRHVLLGGHDPLLLVGKRMTGTRVAYSPDSDLEAFNNNLTHGNFASLTFQQVLHSLLFSFKSIHSYPLTHENIIHFTPFLFCCFLYQIV